MVDSKDATLHEDTQVLLLRILEDGREDIPKGDGYNQPVVCSPDERRKNNTTHTASLLRYGKEGMAVVQEVESRKNLDVKQENDFKG
jgi:hypothetical protein